MQVAPWSSDTFLGQVIVSFSHIESQALAQGGVQGQSPATSYMLADERGKQSMSTIQLQFSCSCERFYRYLILIIALCISIDLGFVIQFSMLFRNHVLENRDLRRL
jgi:hypothetical protein